MALNSKVIYLRKENGSSIKAYVVDYLLDTETEKKYVIIVNADGKSAKGFELVEGDAFILSTEEGRLIGNYKNDDTFRVLTDIYEDGLSFNLKRRKKVITSEIESAGSSITSTIKNKLDIKQEENSIAPIDNNVEKNETSSDLIEASDNELAKNEEAEQVGKDIILEETVNNKLSEETTNSINFSTYQGTIDNNELGKEIIFYVYDQTIVKKYQGKITLIENAEISVSNLKLLEKINVSLDFDIDQYISGEDFEPGACFVDYENYIPTVKMVEGKPVTSARMIHFLRKPMIKQENNSDLEETSLAENKIIVFNGESEFYENKIHYSIWGAIATVVSKKPLTIIPEKNGIKTIIYEDPNATSVEETCQSYQNLYPSLPVYLLHEKNLIGSKEYVLEESDYTAFSVNSIVKNESLLTQGRKILTEKEMIARREAELVALRETNSAKKKR